MEPTGAADMEAVPGACGCRVPSLSQNSVWRAARGLAMGYWGATLSLDSTRLIFKIGVK